MNVTDMVRTRCFVGEEAEGPYKGARVLYVPGSVTPHRFLLCLLRAEDDEPALARVYLGAGNDRVLNLQTLVKAVWVCKVRGIPLDVEYERAGIHYVLVDDVVYRKAYDAHFIHWKLPDGTTIPTRRDDPRYERDRYVEEPGDSE